jgi:hypothetical protein
MARQFLAVHRRWGQPTQCGVSDPAGLLRALAMMAGCPRCEQARFGDSIMVWIDSGSRLLDLLESGDFPHPSLAAAPERGFEKIRSLCLNMKALVPQWRECVAKDGSLLFSIDHDSLQGNRSRETL